MNVLCTLVVCLQGMKVSCTLLCLQGMKVSCTLVCLQGMKVSCTHFQCALYALTQLRDHYSASFCSDFNSNLVSFYINLLLVSACT